MSRCLIILLLISANACVDKGNNQPTEVSSIAAMSVSGLASAIRARKITSEETVQAYLSRIEENDDAGPMTRSVRDAALMLTIMAGLDSLDPATANADDLCNDYI